jgi:hypothetical protein
MVDISEYTPAQIARSVVDTDAGAIRTIAPSTDELLLLIKNQTDTIELLQNLINRLGVLGVMVDTTGAMRVGTHAVTVSGSLTTITTLTGQTNIGGFVASTQVMANNNVCVNTGIRNNINIS